jgi:hypothetical protein
MGWMNAQSVAGQISLLHPSIEGRASYFLVVNQLSKSSAQVARLRPKAASAAAHLGATRRDCDCKNYNRVMYFVLQAGDLSW